MKKLNIPLIIYTVIDLVLIVLLLINVFKLNVLPFKYLLFIIIIVLLLNVIATLFQKLKKKVFKVIGYIIFTLLILISFVGIYYTTVTLKFINKSFNTIKNTYTNTYLVLSNYDDIYDLIDKKIGYYKSIPNIDKSLDKLGSVIIFESISYTNILDLFDALKNKKIDAVIVEKGIYESLKENVKNIPYDSYKKTYSYEITIDEEVKNDKVGDTFNVYISGDDFTNSNSDFNMIVTVNRKTGKILLTSIPRDYNIYMPSLDMKDSLEFASSWGVNVPKEGLEKLFNIDIDYYLKINTHSLVNLVDTLGKVKFCADWSYDTTHSPILDSYEDNKDEKLHVLYGCHDYTGIEILTIARERLAYRDGDRQRQKNCQQIMINIFNKMLDFDSIFKYTEILDNLSDLYTTNIPDKLITGIIKDLVDGKKYEVLTQSVDGTAGAGYIRAGSIYGYVMIPDMSTVEAAIAKINEVSN